MGFQKGHKKVGGRKKKIQPDLSKIPDLKDWLQGLLMNGRETFESNLSKLPPSRYVETYLSMLSYVVPKVQNVSFETKIEAEYKQIALLMNEAPADFVERIAQRLLVLQAAEDSKGNSTNEMIK